MKWTPSQPSRRKYGSIPNSFVYTDLDTSLWFFKRRARDLCSDGEDFIRGGITFPPTTECCIDIAQ